MENFSFLNPHFFWLLLLLPLLSMWYFYKKNEFNASFNISQTSSFKNSNFFLKNINLIFFISKLLAISCIIIALARPRFIDKDNQSKTTKGIDIVMAIDVSGSTLAKDLNPNRLEALKRVASKFVNDRINDRIGLVVYAGESYTKAPVTSDKIIIQQALETVQYDDTVIEDGTGIGVGLATAINRLKDSNAKSRIIILLTDGVNNAGTIDPRMAADIAKEYGIKVYTIGIGTNGRALFPYQKTQTGEILYQMMNVEIDEKLMQEIAQKTDGKYFRATSNKKLQEIYDEINKLEKTEIKEKTFINFTEKYRLFLWIAFVLLALEQIVKNTIFRGFI